MPTGIELIAQERKRQIDEEGWTPAHDDRHTRFELSEAATCYIHASHSATIEEHWPETWSWKWWKPSTTIRNLVKAGALIAAEIDRLQRIEREMDDG